ncbi:MAG TPA: thioredoxin family protein [Gaiellaceae bacterium]|nr:thioredoxin family protein [Gaiellaceae bacterium]
MEANRIPEEHVASDPKPRGKPILLFFTKRTSGPARRMESLIAHVARKERRRLTVVSVDADERPELAERLAVEEIPTLVLVKDRSQVGRIEGRATGGQIDQLIEGSV